MTSYLNSCSRLEYVSLKISRFLYSSIVTIVCKISWLFSDDIIFKPCNACDCLLKKEINDETKDGFSPSILYSFLNY